MGLLKNLLYRLVLHNVFLTQYHLNRLFPGQQLQQDGTGLERSKRGPLTKVVGRR
jgi:hypothetical protein